MKKFFTRVLLSQILMLSSLVATSQSLSLLSGFATDVNNPGNTLNYIPAELRWSPFKGNALSLLVNYDIGLTHHTTGDAYTLNPSLPSHVALREGIRSNILTLGIIFNIKIYKFKTGNNISLSLTPGFSFHHFYASYKDFDTENYQILDEDINRNISGLIMIFGLNYRFSHNKILSINIQTPVLGEGKQDANYRYAAPLRLMFGYELFYKKNT